MTQEQTIARVEGVIEDEAFKRVASGKNKGAMYGTYKIAHEGRTLTVNDFDKVLEGYTKGDNVVLAVTEREATYTDDKGQERTGIRRNAHHIISPDEDFDSIPSASTRPQPPASAPQKPQGTQEASYQGNGGSGWREAFTQSREAHEDTRLSIESQKAYEMAMLQVRDLVVTDKLSPMDDIAKYRRLLTDLTVMGMAAMREAQKNAGGRE